MAQSLGQQLGSLNHQHLQYPSLLYTQQVSAQTDLDTIYHLGCKGMNKLTQIDHRFMKFQQSLYNVQQKGVSRQLQNKQQNQSLDNELRSCLLLMSQYWSFDGTHQAMEYLLRNFKIHEYLPDEVIVYFLIYHNTKMYVRLLQNIVDQQRNSMWGFCYEPISRGQPIPRDLLIRQIQLDYRILRKFLDYQCLLLQKENIQEEIVFTVQDFLYSEEEIQQIKLRQPNQLAFTYAILQDLKVSSGYMDQLRGTFGKLLALCIEENQDESRSFAYLIFNLQLFDSTKVLLTENQISNTAQWVFTQVRNNDKLIDLCVLFYQFGIKSSYEQSLVLLDFDLSKFYNNGLLLLEIIRQLKDLEVPDKPLNQLIVYLKHQLNKNDTYFIDCLVTIIHEKLIPIVRPYLQDTQYKNLFPNYNDIQLTFTNSDKVLLHLNTNAQSISIGTLTNLIEDSLEFFIKSKKLPFIHILKQSLEISEQQFPQTVMFNSLKFYKLIDSLSESVPEIHDDIISIFMYTQRKQEEFNKIESLLLLSVHFPISVVNEITKQLKIGKKAKTKEDYILLIDQQYSSIINNILSSKVQKLKIFAQLKIQLAFVLQKEDQLINFINTYQWEDSFIKFIIESISTLQLLNLTNKYSIQYLKSIDIDPEVFFQQGLNDFGSLKVLLHKSSRNLPFILKLFLIYDDLNVNQQEIFLQIVNEVKEHLKNTIQIQEIKFNAELLQKTIKVFLKNRKEANFIKTTANLKDQDSVLDLQLLYLENFEDLRVRQLKALANIIEKTKAKIQKERISQLIKFVENNFTNEMLDSYIRILRFHVKQIQVDFTFLKKIMFQLPIKLSETINKYIDNTDVFPADVRTQMTIFVYSNSLPNKQVIVQEDLDFGMIVNLLETPNLEIVSHLVQLLRANVQHISEAIIKQCFKLKLESPTVIVLISSLIYDYLEYHKNDLLEQCSQILQLILSKNYDLTVQINYAAVASCVKLIAKHTQINKAKKAFKSLVYPNVQETGTQNALLFYRIVTEQFQNHNSNFFNVSMFAFLIAKIILIIQNMDVNQDMLQNFAFFKLEQWWVILYIQTVTTQPKELVQLFKSQVEKFPYSVKLSLATALSESLFYRAQRHQKVLKVKINQKLTQIQTPNLEASIKKIGTALRSNAKYIKIKLSLLRILELIENMHTNLKKYLLSSDLNEQQGDLLKSVIVHVSKFSNVFAHSKLKALSERIRSDIIHSLKIETFVPLIKNCISIRSVSNILLSAFTDILRLDAIKITKQQIPQLKDLVEQIINEISNPQTITSSEMLLFLNYLYNVQIIQKQLLSQGQQILEILIEQLGNFKEQSSNQALILNLFGLVTQQDTYPFLDKLNEVYSLIVELLSSEYNLILDEEFKYCEDKIINQTSNKAILQAAATSIIKTFKGLISRQHLLQISVLFLMDPYNQGFVQILESIENRVHLDVYISNIVKQCILLKPHVVANCLNNLAILVQKCESELISENYLQLNKELLNVFDFSREQYIDSEMAQGIFEADKLEDQINQVYLEIVLKINDIQFKKLYSSFILWSGKQLNQVGYNFQKYRRIQFFRLSNQISDKLGKYFTKYYAYIWDAIVNELHQFHSIFYETPKQTKLQKRTQDECDMYYRLELLLNKHVLQSISSLCSNDCESFVDTDKFEKLSEPLALTLDCPKVEKYEQILPFIEEWVTPTILALFQLLNDDYKWKDLHHKILMVISRHSNKKNEISSFISIGIVKLIHRIIDQLDERYLVLMNDLIPFLHQLTFSTLNSDELEKRVKQLIVRLSQLSGEDITTALK